MKCVYNFFALQNNSDWRRSQKHYIDTGTLFRSAIFSMVFLNEFIMVLGSGGLLLVHCNFLQPLPLNIVDKLLTVAKEIPFVN